MLLPRFVPKDDLESPSKEGPLMWEKNKNGGIENFFNSPVFPDKQTTPWYNKSFSPVESKWNMRIWRNRQTR